MVVKTMENNEEKIEYGTSEFYKSCEEQRLGWMKEKFSGKHRLYRYYLQYGRYVFGFDEKLDKEYHPPILQCEYYSDNLELLKDIISKEHNFVTQDSYLYNIIEEKFEWSMFLV